MPAVAEIPEEQARTAEEELMASERHPVFRQALMDLPAAQRRLIVMLTAEPAVPDTENSAAAGIRRGQHRPTRTRCLERLQPAPGYPALIEADGTAARDQRVKLSSVPEDRTLKGRPATKASPGHRRRPAVR